MPPRRPKIASQTQRDVAAANDTLDHIFHGRQKYGWTRSEPNPMQQSKLAPRREPSIQSSRPLKVPLATLQHVAEPPTGSKTLGKESLTVSRPSLSTSLSPQLANSTTPHATMDAQESTLPSPAPSVDDLGVVHHGNNNLATAGAESDLLAGQRGVKRKFSGAPVRAQNTSNSVGAPPTPVMEAAAEPRQVRITSREHAGTAPVYAQNSRLSMSYQGPSNPAISTNLQAAPSVQMRLHTGLRNQPKSAAADYHMLVAPLDCLSTDICMRLIGEFQQQCSQSGLKLGHVERSRIHLLKQAAQAGDWFYIVLHKIMCSSSRGQLNSSTVPLIRDIAAPDLAVSLKLVSDLLVSNSQCSVTFVEWAAAFPAPFSRIAHPTSTAFHTAASQLHRFFRNAGNYLDYVTFCKRTACPPLSPQLDEILGVSSPVLQPVLFRAVLRNMHPQLDPQRTARAETVYDNSMRGASEGSRKQFHTMFGGSLSLADYIRTFDVEYSLLLQSVLSYGPSSANSKPPRLHQPQLTTTSNALPISDGLGRRATLPLTTGPPMHSLPGRQHTLPSNDPGGVSPVQLHTHTAPRSAPPSARPAVSRQPPSRPTPPTAQAEFIASHFLQPQPLVPIRPMNTTLPAPRPHPADIQQRQCPVQQTTLIPASGLYAPQSAAAEPWRSALHQADLRAPITVSDPDVDGILYQYVQSLLLPPTKLNDTAPMQEYSFPMSSEQMLLLAKNSHGLHDWERETRQISSTTLSYRLRCVKLNADCIPNQDSWVITDTSWPKSSHWRINDRPLELRRKLHHGKDQPIDITSLIKEGPNEIIVCILKTSDDKEPIPYAFAVEVVASKSHMSIVEECNARTISKVAVLGNITSHLSAQNLDDDIAITSSTQEITLLDPFRGGEMFIVPVRGKACKHRNCFDLETFLQTRKRTDDHPSAPSQVDVWKCPICSADVRPDSLVVDGFLVDVREELQKRERMDVRSIVVADDGSWSIKGMEANAEDEHDDDGDSVLGAQSPDKSIHGAPTRSTGAAKRSDSAAPVVILDDD